jgi:hypothetical protein
MEGAGCGCAPPPKKCETVSQIELPGGGDGDSDGDGDATSGGGGEGDGCDGCAPPLESQWTRLVIASGHVAVGCDATGDGGLLLAAPPVPMAP